MTFTKISFIVFVLYGVIFQNTNGIYTPAMNDVTALGDPLNNYRDILHNPPYSNFCRCDLTPYLDPLVAIELARIIELYNQQICNIHSWYYIIDDVMPTLDDPWRISMIESLSQNVYNEQVRRTLAFQPHYPYFCDNLLPDVYPPVPLMKRSPQIINPVVPSVVDPVVPNVAPSSSLAYYYNMMYTMEKIMPNLSPQLIRDIEDSVYNNSQLPQLGQTSELIRRLIINIRIMISEMFDYTPILY